MKTTQQQRELLDLYCGMWPERAEALLNLAARQHVHPATVTHFKEHGLADGQGCITDAGSKIAKRIHKIMEDKFFPPKPEISPADLVLFESTTRFARMETVKSAGLRSVHLKILRRAARYPYAVYGSYLDVFSRQDMNDLLDMPGFLYITERAYYAPVTPDHRGLSLMHWCVETAQRLQQARVVVA